MHAPVPARERGKHGQAGQEAQQPPASLAAVYSFHYVPPRKPVRYLWQSRFQIKLIPKHVTRLTLFLCLVLGTIQVLMPRF